MVNYKKTAERNYLVVTLISVDKFLLKIGDLSIA